MIPQALDIARRFEGFSPVPYLCPAYYWTIGYGHLCKADSPEITEDEGERLLALDMEHAFAQTVRLCPILVLYGNADRLAAITDFTFNLGAGRLSASTLRRRILAADWPGARAEIRRWVFGGGRKLPGLILRREVERGML